MTPPVPQGDDGARLGLLITATLIAAVIALGLISRLPGPQAPGPFRQMLVLHGSLAAQVDEAADPTHAQGHLRSQLDGQSVDSWLYTLDAAAATVHRLAEPAALPRNAQSIRAPGGSLDAVDFDDLTALCWEDQGVGLCVVGAQPIRQLKELAAQVRSAGPGPASAG